CHAELTESVIDLAHIGLSNLETEARVDPHRVEELPADEFDACDVRLGRADVFLDKCYSVDRIFELHTVHIRLERLHALEKPDTEPLAGAIVLGDERATHLFRRSNDFTAPDCGNRSRCTDAVRLERRILRDLADFQLKRAA